MKILMVCLGNICRSPLAEGIMRYKLKQLGLDWFVDSAGVGHWHAGEQPDKRSIAKAAEHGIDINYQRARQITTSDLNDFDLILTMDMTNYRSVLQLAQHPQHEAKVQMIRNFRQGNMNLLIIKYL